MTVVTFLSASSSVMAGGVESGTRYRHDASFAVPAEIFNDPDFHPAGYLTSFPIPDTGEQLAIERRRALRILFMAAHCAGVAKLEQDYPISTATPVYRLLKANYSNVNFVETEGGQIVMLGQIAHALQSSPQR